MTNKFENINNPQIQKQAEAIQYSSDISEHIMELLNYQEGDIQEEYIEKLTQINVDVKKFLLETEKQEILEQEKKALLFSLLSATKPENQKDILEQNKEFLDIEKNKKHKQELINYLYIKQAIEKTEPWRKLYYFFSKITP
ncbi:MAG: hypothetical protein AAB653_03510, partial [Patescibacteria group bacterium]